MATLETEQSERRAEAKRMLNGYRAFCGMHDSMLRLIEDADSRLLSTTAQMEETVASSSAGDTIGSGLAKLEYAANKLKDVDDRVCAKLDISLWLVEQVIKINPAAGRVLSERYLCPAESEPDFEEIAERLSYSYDWTKHLHLIGLDIAASVIQDNTSKHLDTW